jgi:preprotein translocase SecE subunit
MADKKKNAGRVQQMAEQSAGASERTTPRVTPVKASESVASRGATPPAKAVREARKEQPKQESRPVRRETRASSLQTRFRNNRIGRFIFEAYYELRHKVTWPTPNEARNMTIMVLILSAIVAVILAVADFGLYHLFLLISGGS